MNQVSVLARTENKKTSQASVPKCKRRDQDCGRTKHLKLLGLNANAETKVVAGQYLPTSVLIQSLLRTAYLYVRRRAQ